MPRDENISLEHHKSRLEKTFYAYHEPYFVFPLDDLREIFPYFQKRDALNSGLNKLVENGNENTENV